MDAGSGEGVPNPPKPEMKRGRSPAKKTTFAWCFSNKFQKMSPFGMPSLSLRACLTYVATLNTILTCTAGQTGISAFWGDPYHTCSKPWDVLSLNVNSGKTWWSTVLLSIAPDCPCYNVLYDRGFLWWNNLNLMKIGKNPLGSWIQGFAGSAGSLAFFSKFWLDKRQNWIWGERGI